jgi:hypothetical protein
MPNIAMSFEEQVVVNRVSETTTFIDIAEHIHDHVLSWKGYDELWDMSRLNFAQINREALRKFSYEVERLSESRAGKKAAIVVSSHLGFGMIRMLEGLSEGKIKHEIRVFDEEQIARAWLNHPSSASSG